MSTVVIMPGGFHPFHAGHLALYQAAQRAFPDAEVFVAATNDTSERPFPFAVKEKLAKLAGVEPGHFVQVKSPFRAEEITARFDPEKDALIFVRSEKDADKPPKPGIVKKDGSAGYLQPLLGAQRLEPFSRHAYMAYLPTVEFGPGMTSATEIRQAWPQLNDQRKKALVMSLYPRTQDNDRLTNTVIKMLDTAIVAESIDPITANTSGAGAGMTSTMSRRFNQPAMEATVVNDPEQGLQIRPAGGLGTWTESSLVSNLTRQIQELNRMLDSGNYQGIEYVLYRGGAMQAKIQALAALQRFKQKQGRRPIARGREIEVDEDYVEEKWSEKYKKSINCSNPKGFSQRAHCAGRKKNEDVAEAFGPLPKDNQQIRLGRHTVDIERVGLNNNYIGFTWHDSRGQEHYEEVAVGDLGSYDDLIARIKDEIRFQERQYTDQGVAEGSQQTPFTDEELVAINQYLDDDLSFQALKTYPGLIRKIAAHLDITSIRGHSGEMNFYDRLVQAREEGDIPQQGVAEAQLAEKCWDTHRQAGMKKKGGRMVPNCVPKESQ